jgi:1-phosphatidylinositol-3-phosphate 5-kinase
MFDLAMKNNLDKPLPTIPKQHDSFRLTAILSVEARNHARRFVLHSLEEECSALAKVDWNSEKESWASGMLDSLDTLAEMAATSGWLTGLRQSRMTSIIRNIVKSPVTDPASHSTDDQSEGSADLSIERTRRGLSSRQALQQIQQLLSNPVVMTPKPATRHILLTTDAFEAGETPARNLGFDVIPSRVGCFFTPDFFLLPLSEGNGPIQEAVYGNVLYGLDEWDGQTCEFFSAENFLLIYSTCS